MANIISGGSNIFVREDANSQNGIIFLIFCQQLHENERIWTSRGVRLPGTHPPGSTNDNSWRSIFGVGGPVWEILDPPLLGASILRNSGSVTSKSHSTFISAETFCELSASQQDNSARTFAHLAAIVRITER